MSGRKKLLSVFLAMRYGTHPRVVATVVARDLWFGIKSA